MIPPSILTHGAGGIILIFIFITLVLYFPKLLTLDIYKSLVLLSLFSIVITLHAISHLGLEKEYKYIPFYSWTIKPAMEHRCPMEHTCPMKNMH